LQTGKRLRAAQFAGDEKPGGVSFQSGQRVSDGETIHYRLGRRHEHALQQLQRSKHVILLLLMMLVVMTMMTTTMTIIS